MARSRVQTADHHGPDTQQELVFGKLDAEWSMTCSLPRVGRDQAPKATQAYSYRL